jgi:hypothetical protein
MGYSIDTSSLIWAWRFAYPRERFPSVWAQIENLIRTGDLKASPMVLEELERQEDDLYAWAEAKPQMFIDLDEPQQQEVRAIMAAHRGIVQTGEDRVNADPFVIALARCRGLTVVSEERRSGNPLTPKIPNVCAARGVPCLNLLGMMGDLGWTF